MKQLPATAAVLGVLLAATGCYHAVIDTGKPPAPQTVERPWAPSFVNGLVPPPVVETAARCPNGVSRVETQLSFLNMVVDFLTLGIFTPMSIKVTCAGAGPEDQAAMHDPVLIERNADLRSQQLQLTLAARRSAELEEPIWIVFR